MAQGAADFIIIGAGSAGCAAAASLLAHQAGDVLVLEAGPSDATPLVKMPFGLVWLMGSTRDWRFKSAPQPALNGRQINIPRGRMIGGSSSINSMLWFRGRRDDFDNWGVEGWAYADVAPVFEAVEAAIQPAPLAAPHPLTEGLSAIFNAATPTPEHSSAGVGRFNLHNGRRWSAADAFLRPNAGPSLAVRTGADVARLGFSDDKADRVILKDGTALTARKGIILSAGSVGTPLILMASGIGPGDDLKASGIDTRIDAPAIGTNLHDHPGVGLHFAGPGSGYGLAASQALLWASAPLNWAMRGKGVLASPTVEGSAFFGLDDAATPEYQSHFIPFMLGWQGKAITKGQGYFADAVLCRPKSRGAIRLGRAGAEIDLGLLSDPEDLDKLTAAIPRLRALLSRADFGTCRADEAFPGKEVESPEAIRAFITARCGTAYHPVGTCRMGDAEAPVSPRLRVKGAQNLWVADASVMPQVTSANTNAPSMMIGYRAGRIIAEDAA